MVSKIYHLLSDPRKEKFRAIVSHMGHGGIVNLARITGLTAKFIVACVGDRDWTDSRTEKVEEALGMGAGFLGDGIPVKPPTHPVNDMADLKSWLRGSAAANLITVDTIPLVRLTDVMKLLSGDTVDTRKLMRDGSLSQRTRLIATVCGEDCPTPLQPGDTAVIEIGSDPIVGGPVLAYVPSYGCVLRRYRERQGLKSRRAYELASTNSDFPSFKINNPEDAQVIGPVVQLRRNI